MSTENENKQNDSVNNSVNTDNSNKNKETAGDFSNKNNRYLIIGISAVIIIAAILVLALSGKDSGKETNDPEKVLSKEFEVDENKEIVKLMRSYYKAFAAGDVEALKKTATPISELEQSYIKMFSKRVEKYQNIKCYTKDGLDKDSYIVSVTMSMKFPNIDTKVPSLETFYIRTNDEGELYIDNLYSTFNYIATQEKEVDSVVADFITSYEKQDDFVKLAKEVEKKSEKALKSDEKLAEYIDKLNNKVIPKWLSNYKEALKKKEAKEQKEKEEEQKKQEEEQKKQEEEQKKQEEEQKKKEEEQKKQKEEKKKSKENQSAETVYATSSVNIRETADAEGNLLTTVETGTEMKRTGTEGDWSIVEYNGTKGYVKSEYLSTEVPQQSAPAATLGEGTTITLKETVNIRESMSESAPVVTVGYAGDQATVVMSYAEGWTKVNCRDFVGYIKTELLQ